MLALPPEMPFTPKPKSNPALKTTKCAEESCVHEIAPLFLKFYFYFWLHWVFVAFVQVFSCGEWAILLRCSGTSWWCLSYCRAQALGAQASPGAAHGLNSCGVWVYSLCGMWDLPRQGSNLCLLHWQADSYSLHHQGSLPPFF